MYMYMQNTNGTKNSCFACTYKWKRPRNKASINTHTPWDKKCSKTLCSPEGLSTRLHFPTRNPHPLFQWSACNCIPQNPLSLLYTFHPCLKFNDQIENTTSSTLITLLHKVWAPPHSSHFAASICTYVHYGLYLELCCHCVLWKSLIMRSKTVMLHVQICKRVRPTAWKDFGDVYFVKYMYVHVHVDTVWDCALFCNRNKESIISNSSTVAQNVHVRTWTCACRVYMYMYVQEHVGNMDSTKK